MMGSVYISKKYFASLGNLNIFIYLLVSVISYIFAILLLKVNEVKDLFRLSLSIFKLKK